MQKKILSSLVAGAVAASLLVANVFADGNIVLKPGEDTGLTKVSDPTAAVKFEKMNAAKDWTVGGESDGLWLVGGDNGDIGISLDTLKNCEKLELDYTCDNPIEGTKMGFAFKVHVDVNSRTCEDGGYIFADYLPETWVPYGSGMLDEKQPIKAVNSLETIYQAQIEESGTLSVSAADLLKVFPEDMDYMMGLGIGASNKNDDIAEDSDGEEYSVKVSEIRFVMKEGASNPPASDTEAAETNAAETNAPDTNAPANDKGQPDTGVEGIAVVAGLAILAAGAIVIANKRK